MAERPEVDELTIEECSSENGVIIIATINRPEKLNALNIDVKEAIKSLCHWAQDCKEVLVVIFRGASPLPPLEGKRQKPHAFVAGADFVMIGGQFAGHDESAGEIVERNGKKYKSFHGMSSKKAMEAHYGKMNKYRASEGRELLIPYKGSLDDTVQDYLGGVRSTCTYIGAQKIKDMAKEPPIDQAATSRIKNAIANGSYPIDLDKIADALFDAYKEMKD